MATTLYLEPFGGMAGDMFLAALLDLGDERFTLEDLRALAEALVPGECRLELENVWRGSLSGRLLTVHTPESAASPHRHLADCLALIEAAPLSPAARARAGGVFVRLAEAEARIHGTTPDQIHFHEVGAVDALVDVCGAALALDRLGVERVFSSPPLAGSGTVQCAHGEMPVPAPATAELLRGKPLVLGGGGERLTPTAAAILAEVVESFEAPPGPGAFVAHSVGYGAGHRDPSEGPPNLLRVQLGEVSGSSGARRPCWLMECNLDDMTGEELGFLVQGLREAGALEVWTAPVQMKKDRPAVVVSALCRPGGREALESVLFEHSTTLGVRWLNSERTECEREDLEVLVLGHPVRVQRRRRPGAAPGAGSELREADLAAEYDDLARIARETGRTLREVEQAALAAARASLEPPANS